MNFGESEIPIYIALINYFKTFGYYPPRNLNGPLGKTQMNSWKAVLCIYLFQNPSFVFLFFLLKKRNVLYFLLNGRQNAFFKKLSQITLFLCRHSLPKRQKHFKNICLRDSCSLIVALPSPKIPLVFRVRFSLRSLPLFL